MAMSLTFLLSALAQFILGLVMAALLGPEAFGLYALALAAAVLVQTSLFDWMRLAATRHHHQGAGHLGRRLTGLMAWGLGLAVVLAVILFALGFRLYAMIPLAAASAGFADLRAALIRAEFAGKRYAMQIAARVALSIILMPSAAIQFKTAEAVLAAFALAVLLPAFLPQNILPQDKRETVEGEEGDAPIAAMMRYALPIIGTNLIYLALFFGLRLMVAWEFGLAAAGVFSLALDVGLKLVTTFGSALDLWLFQLAVREAREKGDEAAEERLIGNAGLICAVLSAVMLGMALVLPSFAEVATSPAFREGFVTVLPGLLPGLLLYGIVQYALHPFAQISALTTRLMVAAGLAMAIAGLCLVVIPRALSAPVALFVGMASAALWLILPLRFSFGALAIGAGKLALALGAMSAPCLLMTMMLSPGLLALISMACLGGMAFGAAAYGLDLAGIRTRRSALI